MAQGFDQAIIRAARSYTKDGSSPDEAIDWLQSASLVFKRDPEEALLEMKKAVALSEINMKLQEVQEILNRIEFDDNTDTTPLQSCIAALESAKVAVELAGSKGQLEFIKANITGPLGNAIDGTVSNFKSNSAIQLAGNLQNFIEAAYDSAVKSIAGAGGTMDQRREFYAQSTSRVRSILGADAYKHAPYENRANNHFEKAKKKRAEGDIGGALDEEAQGFTAHLVGIERHIADAEASGDTAKAEALREERRKTQEKIDEIKQDREKIARLEAEKAAATAGLTGQSARDFVNGRVKAAMEKHEAGKAEERSQSGALHNDPIAIQAEYMSIARREGLYLAKQQGITDPEAINRFIEEHEKKRSAELADKDKQTLAMQQLGAFAGTTQQLAPKTITSQSDEFADVPDEHGAETTRKADGKKPDKLAVKDVAKGEAPTGNTVQAAKPQEADGKAKA